MKNLLKNLTLSELSEIQDAVIYTPNKNSAEVLFSVFKPASHYSRIYTDPKVWIDKVEHSEYDRVAYLIHNGAVDSYCGLSYFIENCDAGTYRYAHSNGRRYEIFMFESNCSAENISAHLMATEFKIGDRVRIRKDLQANIIYGKTRANNAMTKFRGHPTIIKGRRDTSYTTSYTLQVDGGEWSWSASMFEKMSDYHGINIPYSLDLT